MLMIAHFYALAASDFVVGPDAPKSQHNVLVYDAIQGDALRVWKIAKRDHFL